MTPRVRFAPSPTGQLHVGNARTALFNWLYARRNGGRFILRIEDTDTGRQQGGAEEGIYEDLVWLGLDWDEGPVPYPGPRQASAEARRDEDGSTAIGHAGQDAAAPWSDGAPPVSGSTLSGGLERETTPPPAESQDTAFDRDASPASRQRGSDGTPACGASGSRAGHGPYRQSERGSFYGAAIETLRAKGAVYPCFCAEEVLEEERAQALATGRTPGYSGRCAEIGPGEAASRIAAGQPFALRYRVRRYGLVSDLLRGTIDFRARQAFDPVVVRRTGLPTYNFAVVIDDAAMEITHVIRGEDHLTNTSLQLRLFEDLELPPPLFAHLPLILGLDGTPLSKRHGATSAGELRRRGYPAEALVNSLALLGWTPPGERVLLAREEMIALFDLERVSATAAVFDFAKLDWISSQVVRAMDRSDRGRRCGEALEVAGLLPAPTGVRAIAGARPAPAEGAATGPAAGDPRARVSPQDAVLTWLSDLGDLLATSIERFEQVPGLARFIFAWDPGDAVRLGAAEGDAAVRALEAFAHLFEAAPVMSPEETARAIEGARWETGLKGRALLHPLRVAVTALESGPELARSLPLIEIASRLGLTPAGTDLASRIRRVLAVATPRGTEIP